MKKLIVIASLLIVIGLLGLSLNSSTDVNIINNHNKINTVSPDINNYNSLLSNKFYYEKSLNISGYYYNVIPYKNGFIFIEGGNNNEIYYYNFSSNLITVLISVTNSLGLILSKTIYNNTLFFISYYYYFSTDKVCYNLLSLNLNLLTINLLNNYVVTTSASFSPGIYWGLSLLTSYNLSNQIIFTFYTAGVIYDGSNTYTIHYFTIYSYNLSINKLSFNNVYCSFNYNGSYNIILNTTTHTLILLNLLNFNLYYVTLTSFNFYLNNVTINNNIEYINSSNYEIVFNFISGSIAYKQLSNSFYKGNYGNSYTIVKLIQNLTSNLQNTGNFITINNMILFSNSYNYLSNGTLYIYFNNTNGINQIAIFTSQIYNLNITSINVQDGLQIGNYYYWNGVISSQSSYQFISIPSNPIIPLNYSGYIYKGSVVKLTAGDFHNGYYTLTFYYNSEYVNIGYNFNDFDYPIMELGLVFLISSFLYMTIRYYKKDIQVMVI